MLVFCLVIFRSVILLFVADCGNQQFKAIKWLIKNQNIWHLSDVDVLPS